MKKRCPEKKSGAIFSCARQPIPPKTRSPKTSTCWLMKRAVCPAVPPSTWPVAWLWARTGNIASGCTSTTCSTAATGPRWTNCRPWAATPWPPSVWLVQGFAMSRSGALPAGKAAHDGAGYLPANAAADRLDHGLQRALPAAGAFYGILDGAAPAGVAACRGLFALRRLLRLLSGILLFQPGQNGGRSLALNRVVVAAAHRRSGHDQLPFLCADRSQPAGRGGHQHPLHRRRNAAFHQR